MKKLLLISFFALTASLLGPQAHSQVVIIANTGVKAADVSKDNLRDVFTGASSTLKGGSHVTPVLLKQGTVQEEFLSTYIGKSDTAFRAGWRSLVFSGQGEMPRSLESETAVVDFVAHNSDAIGYISKSTPHDSVKTLTVR
jgi:ABC-type phosphate transport system substrate-binding protein